MAADILSFGDLWGWYDNMQEEQRKDLLQQISAGISKRPFEAVQKVLEFAPFEAINFLWVVWSYGYDLRVYQKVVELAEIMAQVPDSIQPIIAREWLRRTGDTGIRSLKGLMAEDVKKINKLSLCKAAIQVIQQARQS